MRLPRRRLPICAAYPRHIVAHTAEDSARSRLRQGIALAGPLPGQARTPGLHATVFIAESFCRAAMFRYGLFPYFVADDDEVEKQQESFAKGVAFQYNADKKIKLFATSRASISMAGCSCLGGMLTLLL